MYKRQDNTKKSSSTTSYFTDALFNEVVKDIMAKELSLIHILYPAQDAGAFGCQGAEDRNLLRLHRSCGPAAEKFTIGVVFMNILFFLSPKQDLMYVYLSLIHI